MDSDLRVALDLADLADALAMSRFGGRLRVRRKADGSVVTDADEEVERALRDELARRCSGDAVLGEELGQTGDGPRRWVIDPIDGTRSFISGHGSWGAIIALERDGDVAVGVMTQPVRDRRWYAARGAGAWDSHGRRLQVSGQSVLGDALFCDDYRGSARWGSRRHPGARLLRACGSARTPHGTPMLLTVATGHADLALMQAAPWDLAAARVIVEEAGGRVTDIEGRPRFDTGSALATNGLLHDAALAVLAAD